jgi:uncharacterized membrane protein
VIVLDVVFLVHLLATAFMTGLIWFVQLVHYPLMQHVPAAGFADYEQRHQRQTTWIVAPAMGLELVTGIALMLIPAGGLAMMLVMTNLVLLALLWASTFFVQMPIHHRLTQGHDSARIRRLVRNNWPRTALWSLRSILVLTLLWLRLSGRG